MIAGAVVGVIVVFGLGIGLTVFRKKVFPWAFRERTETKVFFNLQKQERKITTPKAQRGQEQASSRLVLPMCSDPLYIVS